MILVPIPLDKLEASRGHWLPFVGRVAKRQRCFVEQRLADLYSGNVAIILVWDAEKQEARALCGYSIAVRGNDRVFKIVWLTGNSRGEWVGLHADLEKYAQQIGCAGMVAVARPGWATYLKKWGYRKAHIIFEKDFLDG